ncbi:hypothetical protein M3685_18015 [Heyndrickxia oleronia]|jgi:hypothetical protein|uniref:Lipoprotein n=1 Tax=Heyndrickxia oleronia TaxID=38875 RepID=A0A8E2I3V6_9BACI|nr:hypothetical protein [Heyndrickxia oleronia]MCM3455816.1 hypothetical protein [Heyndrickxia oleronia]MEC1375495.1 hypothetical protein [Heyndrickxia oleronia]OOP63706.1 hypothetical protein BWZ43_25420 [Heyndrickxia oleronia]QQZ04008.1 hypothetical protein I5818_20260 [Heyndrickxia oleronia]
MILAFRKIAALFLVVFIILVSSGCEINKKTVQQVNKESVSTLKVKNLDNFKEKTISYTKSSELLPNPAINNISYNIQEYYNSNKKEYQYVLNLKSNPLTEVQKGINIIPYNVIKFSVGALQNKETNTFIKSVSSPMFIKFINSYISDGSYYLFSANKPIKATEFQVEGIFVNAVAFDNKKVGEETYRYISNSKESLMTE